MSLDSLFSTLAERNFRGKSLFIIETGFSDDVIGLIEWLQSRKDENRPKAFYVTSVGLDFNKASHLRKILEEKGLSKYCSILFQDPIAYLSNKAKWADWVFLNSDIGSFRAIEEFGGAASTGAEEIIISDYQKKASFIIDEAKKKGWLYVFVPPDYNVLIRSYN